MGNLVLTNPTYNNSGKFGKSLILSATTGYGQSERIDSQITDTLSITGWFKSSGTGATNVLCGVWPQIYIGRDQNNNFSASYNSYTGLSSNTPAANSAWHYFALVLSPAGGKFYVDGVKKSEDATVPDFTGMNKKFGVGGVEDWGYGQGIIGEIDSLGIWNIAVDGTVVPTGPLLGNESGLIHGYNFESNTSDVTDGTPAKIITPDAAEFVYAPYVWNTPTSQEVSTINVGAYFKVGFSGSQCRLYFSTANNALGAPEIYYRIDGYDKQSPWRFATLASEIICQMPTDTAPAHHHLLEVRYKARTAGPWEAPHNTAAGVNFVGIGVDLDATLKQPHQYGEKAMYFGTSHGEGVYNVSGGGGPNDVAIAISTTMMEKLGFEYGIASFGALGLLHGGGGNEPALPDSWKLKYPGLARSFVSDPPKLIFIEMGQNDGSDSSNDAAFITAGLAMLTEMLAQLPISSVICWMIPYTGNKANAIIAIASQINDPRVRVIDARGWFTGGDGGDNLHVLGPTVLMDVTPRLVSAVKAELAPRRFNVTVS